MRHLIGLLSVDENFIYGVRSYYVMSAISNRGFNYKKAKIGFLKERFPDWESIKNHY